ncbi:hypothetical protein K488DRAFT_85079 [Vararia minispora EC-137]|uniref:Uncharacterized protein n=1 Tax=Vararia minispora EC-137 TaxID=1314806 RepID=A0ACB8QN08_9AGAM|nr:hypothetical protein K488DRAFT_85079 [Vararia minispora EC-137]
MDELFWLLSLSELVFALSQRVRTRQSASPSAAAVTPGPDVNKLVVLFGSPFIGLVDFIVNAVNVFNSLPMSQTFAPKHGDFYVWVERQLHIDAQLVCPEDVERGKEIVHSRSKASFDKPVRITGFKPIPGDNEDVHICSIPNSEFSIRLFGKYMEDKRQYGLDFIRTSTGKSENSPFQYDLFTVPDPDAQTAGPIFGPRSGRLFSVESGLGLEPSEIRPGAERFILSEGMCCLLKRKGHRDVYFKVPVRIRPKASFKYDADILEFKTALIAPE